MNIQLLIDFDVAQTALGQKAKSLPTHKMSAYPAYADIFLICSLWLGPRDVTEFKYCVRGCAAQFKPYRKPFANVGPRLP